MALRLTYHVHRTLKWDRIYILVKVFQKTPPRQTNFVATSSRRQTFSGRYNPVYELLRIETKEKYTDLSLF